MTGLAALLAMHLPGSPIRANLTPEETRRVAACLLAADEAPTDEGATPVTSVYRYLDAGGVLRGLNARHLSFLAHLLTVADEAGVAVVYCCYNNGWGIMTSPKLDDEAGTAFLAALEVGEVGEPTQSDPRVIVAGREYSGNAVRLYVQPLTVSTDTPIEAAP